MLFPGQFYFFFQSKKDAFHPGRVKQVHLYDNMDRDSWVLVYRDVNSSKHFYFAALLLPPIICGFLVLAVDILWNDVHFGFTQKLLNDADEVSTSLLFKYQSFCTCSLRLSEQLS